MSKASREKDGFWLSVVATWRYAVSLLCMLTSFAGLQIAASRTCCAGDAGRGGAIAVAISFLLLFINSNRDRQMLSLVGEGIAKVKIRTTRGSQVSLDLRVLHCEQNIAEFVKSIDEYVEGSQNELFWQNIAMYLSAGIGTVIWGFADLMLPWWQTHISTVLAESGLWFLQIVCASCTHS